MLVQLLKFKILVTLLFVLASPAVLADPFTQDDLNWLKKIVTASHQMDYSGTFIYQSGSYIESSRITHLFDGENEHERLEGLDGERSEIIRKNNKVWCYLGERRVMVASRNGARTFPALLPEQLSILQENYVISHGEEDRVAGFHTHSIFFQPRDNLRYAHKMWAHIDSGLLLKAVVLDEQDRVIEQYAFTQLKVGGDVDRKWIVSNQVADRIPSGSDAISPHASSKLAESGWKVYALPAGFVKINEVSRHLRSSKSPVVHQVYSDGLAGISVFIENLGDKHIAKQGLHSKGVIQIFTRILDNNLLTVIGEVPPHTLIQVAESVRYGGTSK